jgi:4'-phosphopantetheinyl transferase
MKRNKSPDFSCCHHDGDSEFFMKSVVYLEVAPVSEGIDYTGMLRHVSAYKRENILKQRFEIDRKLRVVADILLRCQLAARLGKSLEGITLQKADNGKPYIAGAPFLEFNLSHTRNAVVVALSDKPIGVDIERIRNINMRIAEHVCSDIELSWLKESGADQTLRFFDIWTKKEALLKQAGTGLTGRLKNIDVLGRRSPSLSTFFDNDYVMSVCSEEPCSREDLVKLTETELYEMWRTCIC